MYVLYIYILCKVSAPQARGTPTSLTAFSLRGAFMLSRLLVVAILASHVVTIGERFTGAYLAQGTQKEAEVPSELSEGSGTGTFGEKDKESCETSSQQAANTPLLQHPRAPFFYPEIVYDDVALSYLQDQQWTPDRMVQELQSALDQSLGSTQKEKQKSVGQASQEGKYHQARSRGRHDNGISSESSMDTQYTGCQAKFESGQPQGCQSRDGFASISEATTSTSASQYRGGCNDTRGSQNLGTLAWTDQCRNDSSRRIAEAIRDFGEQREDAEIGQTLVTCTYQQAGQNPEPTQSNSHQDQGLRCRVEQGGGDSFVKNAAACDVVPSSQTRLARAVQRQSQSVERTQEGSEPSIPVTHFTNDRRPRASGSTITGRSDGHTSGSIDGRRSSLLDIGRGGDGCRAGSRVTSKGRQGQGEQGQSFYSISITDKSGQSASESQKRQRQAQRQTESMSTRSRCQHEWSDCGLLWEKDLCEGRDCLWGDTKHVTSERENDLNDSIDHAGKLARRVSFHNIVEVHMWQDNEEQNFKIPCIRFHHWLRSLWHMHGQAGDWNWLTRMKNRIDSVPWSFVSHGEHDPQANAEQLLELSQDEGMLNDDFNSGADDLTSMENSQQDFDGRLQAIWRNARSSEQRRFVDTWFLHGENYRCCTHARRIQITHLHQIPALRQRLKRVWTDMLEGPDFELIMVRSSRYALMSTIVNVLIVQSRRNEDQTAMFRYDGLPVLQRQRAILYSRGSTVFQLFEAAQIQTRRIDPRATCAVEDQSHSEVYYHNDDHLPHREAAVFQAYVRLPVETDTETSTDDDDDAMNIEHDRDDEADEISTTAGTDFEDGDEVNFMSVMPPVFQCEFPNENAYPWLNEDVALEQEQETEVSDAEIVSTEQANLIHEHLDNYAEVVNGEAPMLAITFGLGVTDLGRRDVWFETLDFQDLLGKVEQMWGDHGMHGQLEIFYVQPQPIMEEQNCIVLLVVVDYGAEDPDDARVLVLEHALDIPHTFQPKGSRLNGRVSARCVPLQLGMHSCYPLGVRDCQVRQRGHDMHKDAYEHIEDGPLVTIVVHAYPEHLARISTLLTNTEQFHLHSRAELEQLDHQNGGIILRAHGISPQNRQLGHRDVILNYDRLQDDAWIH